MNGAGERRMASDGNNNVSVKAAVTQLLNEAGAGNVQAAAEVLPLVYEQIRAMARDRMRN